VVDDGGTRGGGTVAGKRRALHHKHARTAAQSAINKHKSIIAFFVTRALELKEQTGYGPIKDDSTF